MGFFSRTARPPDVVPEQPVHKPLPPFDEIREVIDGLLERVHAGEKLTKPQEWSGLNVSILGGWVYIQSWSEALVQQIEAAYPGRTERCKNPLPIDLRIR